MNSRNKNHTDRPAPVISGQSTISQPVSELTVPELSVVVPAYNEEQNIDLLYQRLCETLEGAEVSFEIVLINDASTDCTLDKIKALSAADPRVRYAAFSRNFGHEAASSCGLRMARGHAAVLMDADLQDPPEVILDMLALWRQGYDVVYGRRLSRLGESWLKKSSSFLFYRLFNHFSQTPIPADVGDFRLVNRRVLDVFNQLPERNRFVRGMVSWVGFRQTKVDYQRHARHRGDTKYNWIKLLILAFEALSSFSVAPLRLCIAFGALVTLLSFSAAAIIVFQRMFFDLEAPGYALATSGMFLLGGVQLVFLGVLGEYIGKIYTQVQGRPLYVIADMTPDDIDESAAPLCVNSGTGRAPIDKNQDQDKSHKDSH